ncbi:hypothetical protein LH428_07515 [Laribacter hongkongensis]|uniref:hypothetical protein n=1 Tax=Laribacter hongkongensis TaxID=168471 RepID=UPI001EFE35A2|nr:hypothetical protein [Laribacter hongkongensis]MCG9115702.1 hypothetical protein [Laribacter hongkongensis]
MDRRKSGWTRQAGKNIRRTYHMYATPAGDENGKNPLHRKSTRNSRDTWLKTLSGAGAGVAGGFCLYFVFEMVKITGLSAGAGAPPTGQNRHLKKVYKPVVLAAMTILFPL